MAFELQTTRPGEDRPACQGVRHRSELTVAMPTASGSPYWFQPLLYTSSPNLFRPGAPA